MPFDAILPISSPVLSRTLTVAKRRNSGTVDAEVVADVESHGRIFTRHKANRLAKRRSIADFQKDIRVEVVRQRDHSLRKYGAAPDIVNDLA